MSNHMAKVRQAAFDRVVVAAKRYAESIVCECEANDRARIAAQCKPPCAAYKEKQAIFEAVRVVKAGR